MPVLWKRASKRHNADCTEEDPNSSHPLSRSTPPQSSRRSRTYRRADKETAVAKTDIQSSSVRIPRKGVPSTCTGDSNSSGQVVKLQRSITLLNGCTIIVGCIIGSGIFVSPKGVHEYSGSVGLSLVLWVFGGFFAALGAYCYAELGTLIRKSGGDYAYITTAFGPFIGFIRLWIEAIVIRPCSATITALTFAKYALVPVFGDCNYVTPTEPLLACCCLFVLTFVNCCSVKMATKIQDILTYAKIGALILIVLTGLTMLVINPSDSFENPFEGTSRDAKDISLALYSGLFAYNGWNYLNFIVEELQNPKRNLPLAIGISCTIVTVIYTLTNIAFYAVIPAHSFLDSDATAMTFANKVYGSFAWIMPIFVACSTVGSCNGVILTASRLFFAGAREGHMPQMLTLISIDFLTPIPAILATGILACLFLALSQDIYQLINCIQIVNWLAVNLIFPSVFLIGCVFLVIVPIIANPIDTAIGLLIMLTSIPVYILCIWKRPKAFSKLSNDATEFIQKIFMAVPEESEAEE
uniref:Amino acid permease/ SLC12A domain-containing protein n=1 Tax=Trichuris muris TaxID=70415 RepID=A0A5S6Q2A2_TRIMR